MLQVHPLERPNIVDVLERLQDIAMTRNVSPKEPIKLFLSIPATADRNGDDLNNFRNM